ncbi:MAG: hypothetical protein AB1389_03190 [Campylobacterota bacterium]
MKFLVTILLASGLLFANQFKVGDNLSSFSCENQFEKKMAVAQSTKKMIVAFSKEKGEVIKQFLDKNPDYLKTQNALYIADVSSAPAFVTSMFMIPKFKSYSFEMGIIKDEAKATQFPKKDDMITVISLENGVIKNIEFKPTLP